MLKFDNLQLFFYLSEGKKFLPDTDFNTVFDTKQREKKNQHT